MTRSIKSNCQVRHVFKRSMDELHEKRLSEKLQNGTVTWYGYRPFTLKCGPGLTYEPTFSYICPDGQLVCESVTTSSYRKFRQQSGFVFCKSIYPFIKFRFTRYNKSSVQSEVPGRSSEKCAEIPVKYRSSTESDYGKHLSMMYRGKYIKWFAHEHFSLRLAANTYYIPDFVFVNDDGQVWCDEVKGTWRAKGQTNARTKLKAAAEIHPYLRFRAVMRKGSGWDYEEF